MRVFVVCVVCVCVCVEVKERESVFVCARTHLRVGRNECILMSL